MHNNMNITIKAEAESEEHEQKNSILYLDMLDLKEINLVQNSMKYLLIRENNDDYYEFYSSLHLANDLIIDTHFDHIDTQAYTLNNNTCIKPHVHSYSHPYQYYYQDQYNDEEINPNENKTIHSQARETICIKNKEIIQNDNKLLKRSPNIMINSIGAHNDHHNENTNINMNTTIQTNLNSNPNKPIKGYMKQNNSSAFSYVNRHNDSEYETSIHDDPSLVSRPKHDHTLHDYPPPHPHPRHQQSQYQLQQGKVQHSNDQEGKDHQDKAQHNNDQHSNDRQGKNQHGNGQQGKDQHDKAQQGKAQNTNGQQDKDQHGKAQHNDKPKEEIAPQGMAINPNANTEPDITGTIIRGIMEPKANNKLGYDNPLRLSEIRDPNVHNGLLDDNETIYTKKIQMLNDFYSLLTSYQPRSQYSEVSQLRLLYEYYYYHHHNLYNTSMKLNRNNKKTIERPHTDNGAYPYHRHRRICSHTTNLQSTNHTNNNTNTTINNNSNTNNTNKSLHLNDDNFNLILNTKLNHTLSFTENPSIASMKVGLNLKKTRKSMGSRDVKRGQIAYKEKDSKVNKSYITPFKSTIPNQSNHSNTKQKDPFNETIKTNNVSQALSMANISFPMANTSFPMANPLFPMANTTFPMANPLIPMTNTSFPMAIPLISMANPLYPMAIPLIPMANPLIPMPDTSFPMTNTLFPMAIPLIPKANPSFTMANPSFSMANPTNNDNNHSNIAELNNHIQHENAISDKKTPTILPSSMTTIDSIEPNPTDFEHYDDTNTKRINSLMFYGNHAKNGRVKQESRGIHTSQNMRKETRSSNSRRSLSAFEHSLNNGGVMRQSVVSNTQNSVVEQDTDLPFKSKKPVTPNLLTKRPNLPSCYYSSSKHKRYSSIQHNSENMTKPISLSRKHMELDMMLNPYKFTKNVHQVYSESTKKDIKTPQFTSIIPIISPNTTDTTIATTTITTTIPTPNTVTNMTTNNPNKTTHHHYEKVQANKNHSKNPEFSSDFHLVNKLNQPNSRPKTGALQERININKNYRDIIQINKGKDEQKEHRKFFWKWTMNKKSISNKKNCPYKSQYDNAQESLITKNSNNKHSIEEQKYHSRCHNHQENPLNNSNKKTRKKDYTPVCGNGHGNGNGNGPNASVNAGIGAGTAGNSVSAGTCGKSAGGNRDRGGSANGAVSVGGGIGIGNDFDVGIDIGGRDDASNGVKSGNNNGASNGVGSSHGGGGSYASNNAESGSDNGSGGGNNAHRSNSSPNNDDDTSDKRAINTSKRDINANGSYIIKIRNTNTRDNGNGNDNNINTNNTHYHHYHNNSISYTNNTSVDANESIIFIDNQQHNTDNHNNVHSHHNPYDILWNKRILKQHFDIRLDLCENSTNSDSTRKYVPKWQIRRIKSIRKRNKTPSGINIGNADEGNNHNHEDHHQNQQYESQRQEDHHRHENRQHQKNHYHLKGYLHEDHSRNKRHHHHDDRSHHKEHHYHESHHQYEDHHHYQEGHPHHHEGHPYHHKDHPHHQEDHSHHDNNPIHPHSHDPFLYHPSPNALNDLIPNQDNSHLILLHNLLDPLLFLDYPLNKPYKSILHIRHDPFIFLPDLDLLRQHQYQEQHQQEQGQGQGYILDNHSINSQEQVDTLH